MNSFPCGRVTPNLPPTRDYRSDHGVIAECAGVDVLLSSDPFADDWKRNVAFVHTMRSNMMAADAPKGKRLAKMIVEQWKKGHGRFVEHLDKNCHDLVELNDEDAACHLEKILLRPYKPHQRVSHRPDCVFSLQNSSSEDSTPPNSEEIESGDDQEASTVSRIPYHPIALLAGMKVPRRTSTNLPMIPAANKDVERPCPPSSKLSSVSCLSFHSPARREMKEKPIDTATTPPDFHKSAPQDKPHVVARIEASPGPPLKTSALPSFQLTKFEQSCLGPNDVVTGHYHSLFHQFVRDHHHLIKDALECSKMIVLTWRQQGGRFLDRDTTNGELVIDIGDDRARNRVLVTLFTIRTSIKRVTFQDMEDGKSVSKRQKRQKSPSCGGKTDGQVKRFLRRPAISRSPSRSQQCKATASLYSPMSRFRSPNRIVVENKDDPVEKTILQEIGTQLAFHAEKISMKASARLSRSAPTKKRVVLTIKAGRSVGTQIEIAQLIPASSIRHTDVLYDHDNVRDHVGNIRYRKWLEDYCKKGGSSAKENELGSVARSYVCIARSFGGRFLAVADGGWQDIGDDDAVARTVSMLQLLRFMPSLAQSSPDILSVEATSILEVDSSAQDGSTSEAYSFLLNIKRAESLPSWEKAATSSQSVLIAAKIMPGDRSPNLPMRPTTLFIEPETILPIDMGSIHDVMFSNKETANPRFGKVCDEALYHSQMMRNRASSKGCFQATVSLIIQEWAKRRPPGRFFVQQDDKSWVQYSGKHRDIRQKVKVHIRSMHGIKSYGCLDADVLIGKNDCYRRDHPGNDRLYGLILASKNAFAAAAPETRLELACDIGKTITDEGGLFRQFHNSTWQTRVPATKVAALILTLLKRETGFFDNA